MSREKKKKIEGKNVENWMMENFEASLESSTIAFVFVFGKIMLEEKKKISIGKWLVSY